METSRCQRSLHVLFDGMSYPPSSPALSADPALAAFLHFRCQIVRQPDLNQYKAGNCYSEVDANVLNNDIYFPLVTRTEFQTEAFRSGKSCQTGDGLELDSPFVCARNMSPKLRC